MQHKNSHNNTQVFNRPCMGKQNALMNFLLAQKKMAELEPLCLVMMDRNASSDPQDQKEVPCPLPHILYIFFQITERCSLKSARFLRPYMRAYWSFALPSRRTMITPTQATPSSSRSHIDWKTLLFFINTAKHCQYYEGPNFISTYIIFQISH